MIEEKSGAETTEGWAGMTGSLASLTTLFTASDWRVQLGSVAVFGAIVCTFIWSRTRVKSCALGAPEKPA